MPKKAHDVTDLSEVLRKERKKKAGGKIIAQSGGGFHHFWVWH